MAKWASFFEHLYICQKYPFSLKARRRASRLPPAAFFREKTLLGGPTTAAAAEEFPIPARPHPITQGYHIPFGSSPSLRRKPKLV